MKNIRLAAALFVGILAFACGQKAAETSADTTSVVSTPSQNDSLYGAVSNDGATDMAHSAETSLDYEGTYEGTTPCADCPGIKTVIEISKDKTFTSSMTYLERNTEPLIEKGTWSIKGSYITLTYADKNSTPRKIFVGENYIQLLDGDGKKITGPLAKSFILSKVR